ncbi:MAG: S-methyl-5'-thioadenosine phosphorylase [Actinomycetota bacterium]
MSRAKIGVFGGSGFYSFLDEVEEVEVDTPYGKPSAPIVIGEIENRNVAFLPRHGRRHEFPPHKVPYRANLWAMKQLGVERLIGPCAAGSLRKDVEPGHFVVCDQLVDRTSGRADTFYDGPETTHISFAEPYCPTLRELVIDKARVLGIKVHQQGTVVVVQGPRFSTRSESEFYRGQGWEVVNMTQYPEVALARELEMCYVNISLITDYDVGIEGEDIEAVTNEAVIDVFNANNNRLRSLLVGIAPEIPVERDCPCATALEGARFEVSE